jgi:hypothetical protein
VAAVSFEPAPAIRVTPRAGAEDGVALGGGQRRRLRRGPEGHQAAGAVVDDGVREVFQRAGREVPVGGERRDQRDVEAFERQ